MGPFHAGYMAKVLANMGEMETDLPSSRILFRSSWVMPYTINQMDATNL